MSNIYTIKDKYHGNTLVNSIEQELLNDLKYYSNYDAICIVTGYGSNSGICESKKEVLRCLNKLKGGLVKAYFPGDIINKAINSNDQFYIDYTYYKNIVKNEEYFKQENKGVIYVFTNESVDYIKHKEAKTNRENKEKKKSIESYTNNSWNGKKVKTKIQRNNAFDSSPGISLGELINNALKNEK